jgi:predicted dehydrogenase
MRTRPIQVGIIGLGGYAGAHHRAVRDLEQAGHCRLVCACDPAPRRFSDRTVELDFAGRGVDCTDEYLTMLDRHAGSLDVVVIPTPIPLHREMHRACVERGIPVYLEKPPTLDWFEFQAMLETETQARRSTFVGFNFIVEPARLELKRRLAAGEFGALQRVSFRACWPRGSAYYQRSRWAGRLLMGDQLVLDAPLCNACSHFLFNLLFWCGVDDVLSWADVAFVQSECYRAHPIEGTDTMFVAARTVDGVALRAAASHTGTEPHDEPETVICERATIQYSVHSGYRVLHGDGREESGPPFPNAELLPARHRSYFDYLRGETDRPLVTLSDCTSFVRLCGLIYVAARRIHTIGEGHRDVVEEQGQRWMRVHGMRQVLEDFDRDGTFPSARNLPWSAPGGSAASEDISTLRVAIETMRE